MTAELEAYVRARDDALRAALDSLRAERRLADDDGSVLLSGAADAVFCLAARRLARAVDELPPERRPKGWGETGTPDCNAASPEAEIPGSGEG